MAPFKRQRQPKMTTQALLDFDLGESSSDSDFRIDDYDSENSKDEDDDGEGNSTSATPSTSSDDDDDVDTNDGNDSEDSTQQLKELLAERVNVVVTENNTDNGIDNSCKTVSCGDLEAVLRKIDSKTENLPKVNLKPICCVCLGDRSDDSNEIVECDGCGVSVHEGCYGVSDNNSISSTNSTCSTEPWFCEACRADVQEPTCELCPNRGGIYKETDVGKWVHLVCALYVPGVAFGEVDQLSSVTLFEMQYSKWGGKSCSLCENSRFARTGVCIGCDAGMCKTYFHVTCAQAAGLLTEAHHEEADVADPFYAHCKVHSEKDLIKKRKRNFYTLQQNLAQKVKERKLLKLEDPAQMRIKRKLLKHQNKYGAHKKTRPQPWVPTQKMSRLLTTSASACRRLMAKAEVMSVDVDLMERQEAQIAALTDIRKKWHIAPAFSVEFIAYYLDRIARTKELKLQLNDMIEQNDVLTKEQNSLRGNYDELLEQNKDLKTKHENLLDSINELQKQVSALCPNKNLQNPSNIGCPSMISDGVAKMITATTSTPTTISVPTAAALKMGVGFPLVHLGPPGTKVDSTRLLSTHMINSPNSNQMPISSPTTTAASLPALPSTSSAISTSNTPLVVTNHECGICKKTTDQHLLAKCDTCQLYYHLGCLYPPLTRHPKKSKLYGWQCSECDKSDESDMVTDLPKGPRKSRTRFNKDGIIVPVEKDEIELNGKSQLRRHSLDIPFNAATGSSKKCLNKSLPATPVVSAYVKNCATSSERNKDMRAIKKATLSSNDIKSNPINQQNSSNMTQTLKEATTPIESMCKEKQNTVIEREEIVLNATPTAACTIQIQSVMESDSLMLPNNTITGNGPEALLDEINDTAKQARKQKRKDRHKNKYNPLSGNEKFLNKEHKRKRKKNRRDSEAPGDMLAGIPKIKIKFKTLPLPGEVTPEAQFFYVPANMVRSAGEASRPTSVETVDNSTPPLVSLTPTTLDNNIIMSHKCHTTPPRSIIATTTTTITPTSTQTKKIITNSPSPRKSSPRKSAIGQRNTPGSGRKAPNSSIVNQVLICCICQNSGTPSNTVTCDECRRHYHFTCLDPPLKKSPKIRGYSWHCADCDPTEDEKF